MKKHILFFTIIIPLLTATFFACTDTHEDDIIIYVPKQVREIRTEVTQNANGENVERQVEEKTYSLTYDSDGRIRTETGKTEDGVTYTTNLNYDASNNVDSVRIVYTTVVGTANTLDSTHLIFNHGGNIISIRQVTFVKNAQQTTDTVTVNGQITLNGQLLPQTYTIDSIEERYSYNADSLLTAIEHYESSALTWKRTYIHDSSIKSPYREVPYCPAWYLVVYRQISPAGFVVKATEEANGAAAKDLYMLDNFTLSDLGFITHASKTYYNSTGTQAVTYRQDYQKVVFD